MLRVNELVQLKETIEVAENAPFFRGCIVSKSQKLKTVKFEVGDVLIVREINEGFTLDGRYGISWPAHVLLTPLDKDTTILVNLLEVPQLLQSTGETLKQDIDVLLTNYTSKNGIHAVTAFTNLKQEGEQIDYTIKEKTDEGLVITLCTDLDVSDIKQIHVELKAEQGTFIYMRLESGDYIWDLKKSVVNGRLGDWFDNPRGKRYLKIV